MCFYVYQQAWRIRLSTRDVTEIVFVLDRHSFRCMQSHYDHVETQYTVIAVPTLQSRRVQYRVVLSRTHISHTGFSYTILNSCLAFCC